MVQEWGKRCAARGGRCITHFGMGNAASEELHLPGKQRKWEFLSHFAFKTRNGLTPSTEVLSLQRKGRDEVSQDVRVDFEQQRLQSSPSSAVMVWKELSRMLEVTWEQPVGAQGGTASSHLSGWAAHKSQRMEISGPAKPSSGFLMEMMAIPQKSWWSCALPLCATAAAPQSLCPAPPSLCSRVHHELGWKGPVGRVCAPLPTGGQAVPFISEEMWGGECRQSWDCVPSVPLGHRDTHSFLYPGENLSLPYSYR